jgi:hypothetical protein
VKTLGVAKELIGEMSTMATWNLVHEKVSLRGAVYEFISREE